MNNNRKYEAPRIIPKNQRPPRPWEKDKPPADPTKEGPPVKRRMGSRSYEVNKFHDNDDLDTDRTSHHHTLGMSAVQAAPGNVVADLIKRVEALEAYNRTNP